MERFDDARQGPGRYPRRLFLRNAGIGAGALTLPGLLAACGGESRGGGGSTSTASAPASGDAKPGGTMIFAVDNLTGTFDPALFATLADWMAVDMIARGLTFTNFSTGEIEPALAESWETSKDGRTYMFTLRQGATFHDGSPVTAKDFERTWQRMFDPKDKSVAPGGYGALFLGAPNTRGFKAMPDGRFRVDLERPDVSLLAKCATQAGSVLPAAAIEKIGKRLSKEPVAAGPFKLTNFTNGQKATFERFDGFYGGKPLLDKIIFQVISEPTALATAVQSGQAHASIFVPLSSLKTMGDKVTVERGKNYVSHFAFLNVDAPALKEPEVRRAINLALDRSSIVKSGFDGYADEPGYVVPPAALGGDAAALKELSRYDAGEAKSLVESAGATGREVRVVSSNARWWPAVGQIVEANLKAAGLKPKMEYLDQSAFLAKTSDPKQHDISLDTYAAILADPDDAAYSIFKSDQFYATSITSTASIKDASAQIDELIAKGRETEDEAERAAVYVDMQQQAAEKFAAIAMLAQNAAPLARASELVGFDLDALGTYRMFPETIGFV